MGGVIDEDGTQWERCNNCGKFVKIETLRYEEPSERYEYGRDLCKRCASGRPPARKVIVDVRDGIIEDRVAREDDMSIAEAKRIHDEVVEMTRGKRWEGEEVAPGITSYHLVADENEGGE